jgi:hypothetical protein
VATMDIYIPLVLNRGYGFFGEGVPESSLFGHRVTVVGSRPPTVGQSETVQGLCIHDVEEENVLELVTRVRALLLWASVALNKSIQTDAAAPQKSDSGTFDGRTTCYYPAGLAARPALAWASHFGAEAYSKLVDALAEGDHTAGLNKLRSISARLRSAFDFYLAADFEASENASFIVLTACLEVLATSPHPNACVDMVRRWENEGKDAAKQNDERRRGGAASTNEGNEELRVSFDELARSVSYLRSRSIRGSIRRLVAGSARALGREDSAELGKKAATLYQKRSALVHRAENVMASDVSTLRELVRMVLAAHALGRRTAPDAGQ